MQVYYGSWMDLELLISRIRPEVKVLVPEANNDVSVITIPAARSQARNVQLRSIQICSIVRFDLLQLYHRWPQGKGQI
jgi:hypothetical protein